MRPHLRPILSNQQASNVTLHALTKTHSAPTLHSERHSKIMSGTMQMHIHNHTQNSTPRPIIAVGSGEGVEPPPGRGVGDKVRWAISMRKVRGKMMKLV